MLTNVTSPCVGASSQRTTTFVVIVEPTSLIDVCRIMKLRRMADADVHSDIVPMNASDLGPALLPPLPSLQPAVSSDLKPPPLPPLPPLKPDVCMPCNLLVLGFPLEPSRPYLCSQGVNGRLSHFAHASTRYAIDLDCPLGTPVLAVADGTVHAVRDGAPAGGVDVSLLFSYNALSLRLEDDGEGIEGVVEYVHFRAGSVRVAAGERVRRGQILCESGQAGFCPTPHLHIEAHRSDALHDAAAPSVPIAFATATDGRWYVPEAGYWYDALVGSVPPPLTTSVPEAALPVASRTAMRAPADGRASGSECDDRQDNGDGVSDDSSGGWETMSDEDE